MSRWENETEARNEILGLVKEFYNTFKDKKEGFTPGDRIPYASRVFDEKEMCSLVDSALDFWLTTGRFSEQFEKKFAEWGMELDYNKISIDGWKITYTDDGLTLLIGKNEEDLDTIEENPILANITLGNMLRENPEIENDLDEFVRDPEELNPETWNELTDIPYSSYAMIAPQRGHTPKYERKSKVNYLQIFA